MDKFRTRPASSPAGELPQAARSFVSKFVSSVAELEALLLLRLRASDNWTAASLGTRLYVSDEAAFRLLEVLYLKGFVIKAGEYYRFAPAREELRAGTDAVALAYPRFLIAITQLIHERTPAARSFADAFKLRDDQS